MKKSYDFSNGIKGKFYISEDEIEVPIYLDSSNQAYFLNIAKEKKTAISKLVNQISPNIFKLQIILGNARL